MCLRDMLPMNEIPQQIMWYKILKVKDEQIFPLMFGDDPYELGQWNDATQVELYSFEDRISYMSGFHCLPIVAKVMVDYMRELPDHRMFLVEVDEPIVYGRIFIGPGERLSDIPSDYKMNFEGMYDNITVGVFKRMKVTTEVYIAEW